MKYKGVELKVGNEFESELCIGIEYDNTKVSQDSVIKMIWSQIKNDNEDVVKSFAIEPVLDNYILVHNYEFLELNHPDLIENLKFIYDMLAKIKDVTVMIDIHTDDWFGEDEQYNNDTVDWDEFLCNLEY